MKYLIVVCTILMSLLVVAIENKVEQNQELLAVAISTCQEAAKEYGVQAEELQGFLLNCINEELIAMSQPVLSKLPKSIKL